MSGIKLDKKALGVFEEMKKKRTHKYMIFSIKKEKVIIIDSESGLASKKPSYEDFAKAVVSADGGKPCWGVIDYEAKKKDGSLLNRLVMVSWCPDDSGVKAKMLHGSTTNTIKSKLGIDKTLQASAPSECEESVVRELLGLK
mmetsp:Transcript_34459/g.83349  ORF Transcript_34459/g.83349 Transcript_34459/m.83349 type:complete len:142 (+) Transcript_34459:56-481(+)|eukprot:CAMPEP_0114513922 /NCGR_PEP_ID=MMETSP0109-20121206/15860_1 /TAXON_ID=29199 /ORGANISM="Chlorarachnion reptans, Strain CCCM449" /LENGTH=141 /DNA_ID=CAMNT_0001693891 /DNA_START=46 /DNA_END=471 /DNA_ORIENTATION=+